MIITRTCIAAGLTSLALLPSPSVRADSYSFVNFDGPGQNGGGTTVNAINNNGAVVGFSSDNAATPTLFTNFVRNPNGSFTTLNINNDPLANANGINDVGVVVGLSQNNAFSLDSKTNSFTALPPAKPGDTGMENAFGINKAGVIVGQFTQNSTDTQPGFVLANGVFTIFQATNTSTVTNVQNIDNNGLAIGFYSADGVHQHGFTYDTVSQQILLLADPNIANLELTQFLGVNDKGLAVGYYQTNDGSQHGFLYNLKNGTYSFLDDPNAAKSGFSITQITGINNSNEITGFYVDATTGLQRGFVATAVPEPGSILLAGFGLAFALGYTRRRNKQPATA
ncbi:PEP-CTERM sorting domain-containing protein [Paludisphaera borealis]|uniref:Ice-binding protein C-terminal domain-containing protein n=1 Tax=Paludisphaera borealis TaxID=1387353 RepID=A0A1U7CVH8_9BACT|nr:PEP-CTERM sorting domain-containing protein [Paludisphaera borealis]APW62935.1 hypothetical protein BSF38_04491 [Paludisphaera borealis]